MNDNCPVDSGHKGLLINIQPQSSPHYADLRCAECNEFIKWLAKRGIASHYPDEFQEALDSQDRILLCPLSFLVHGPRSVGCKQDQCAWWEKADRVCAVIELSSCLGIIANWRPPNAT